MKNIKIYTTNHCGYCDAAKALLKNHGLTYQEINIYHDHAEQVALIKKTGHRTLPQIFIDEEFIGGYTELRAYFRTHDEN